jgi:cysteine desulfurase / selenocysteine lyase
MSFDHLFDREMFPVLKHHPDLIYFDNAATTQTHVSVLHAMNQYYTEYRASVSRGEHWLQETASRELELARSRVAGMLGVSHENILFTTGTTDGLNMIAEWHKDVPVVIITEAEHNANIVPWLAQGRTVHNGRLCVLPFPELGSSKTDDILRSQPPGSLMSITARSNLTGEYSLYWRLSQMAKAHNHTMCVDLAQDVAHAGNAFADHDLLRNVDWAVFSAHKMYGPTGVGALYSKTNFDELRPLKFGGGSSLNVTFSGVDFNTGVTKHEPGTPNIASIIGFGIAAELVHQIGIHNYRLSLAVGDKEILDLMSHIPGLELINTPSTSNMFTFVPKCSSQDVATALSTTNLVVRTGRMCAHPYADKLSGNRGLVRLSLAPYNTVDEIKKAGQILRETMHKLI